MDEKNKVVCIEGNGSRPSHHGDGYKETDKMYSLNTVDRHAVAYAVGNGQLHQTQPSDVARPLDCMHDQQMVVIALDRAAYNQGENAQFDFSVDGGGIAQTIVAKGPGAVCYRSESEASVQGTTRE